MVLPRPEGSGPVPSELRVTEDQCCYHASYVEPYTKLTVHGNNWAMQFMWAPGDETSESLLQQEVAHLTQHFLRFTELIESGELSILGLEDAPVVMNLGEEQAIRRAREVLGD